jgi:hypothetical protein
VERWLVCRVVLHAYRRRQAFVAVRTWTALEPGTRQVLLLRGRDGAVFQVAGFVKKSAAGVGHYLAELQMPWDAAVSLAAWAGKAVKEGGATVLHSYVAQVRGMALPPLKLVYDGYAVLRGPFIYKVLDADPGRYLLEILLGGGSLLIPLKYYKYRRKNHSVGGDAGVFQLPLDALRTLRDWGVYDLDAEAVRLRVKVWTPQKAASRLAEVASAGRLVNR